MNLQRCIFFLLASLLCFGCAGQKIPLKEPVTFAPLADFKQGPKGGVDLVWSTKNIIDAETLITTLQGYDSLMLDQTWLLADSTTSRRLESKQVLATSQSMINQLKARLGQSFKLVDTASENTLRLSFALSNIETALPVLAATSRLVPATYSPPSVSEVVIGEQVQNGGVSVELLVSDASTMKPLILLIDRQFDFQDVGTMIDSRQRAEDAITLWADRLWTTLSYWNWIKRRTPSS